MVLSLPGPRLVTVRPAAWPARSPRLVSRSVAMRAPEITPMESGRRMARALRRVAVTTTSGSTERVGIVWAGVGGFGGDGAALAGERGARGGSAGRARTICTVEASSMR